MTTTNKFTQRFLMVLLMSLVFLLVGCLGGKNDGGSGQYGLSIITSAKNEKSDSTAVYVTVKNTGLKTVTFVKCEYTISDVAKQSVVYSGTFNVVDRLLKGQSVIRNNEGIGENLIMDNDGRNFQLKVKCYSQEMQTEGLYREAYYDFT